MSKLLVIGPGPNWPAQKADYIQKGITAEAVDILPAFQPDIVRDILRGLPYNSNQFDEVKIYHVLEHISGMAPMYPTDNFDFVMGEILRVLKPGGIVDIEVPYFHDDIAVEAAGHVRFFVENSFINYYQNPHATAMGQPTFSKCLGAQVVESGRSGVRPARVVKVQLQK